MLLASIHTADSSTENYILLNWTTRPRLHFACTITARFKYEMSKHSLVLSLCNSETLDALYRLYIRDVQPTTRHVLLCDTFLKHIRIRKLWGLFMSPTASYVTDCLLCRWPFVMSLLWHWVLVMSLTVSHVADCLLCHWVLVMSLSVSHVTEC